MLLPRVLRFRKEVMLLWQAFRSPLTPLYLKIATVAVAVYLVNPFDLIPDLLPFLGWVDDLVLVPLMVSWIVGRLPVPAKAQARGSHSGTVETTYRRM